MYAMDRMQKIPLGQLYPTLAPGEDRLLSVLIDRGGGGLTVSALSEAINMPMPTVSRLMRSMEERGLIVRSIVPQDRRSILVTATPNGVRVHEELCGFFHSFFRELFACVESDELDRMIYDWNLLMDRMEVLIPRYNALMMQVGTAGCACSAFEAGPVSQSVTAPSGGSVGCEPESGPCRAPEPRSDNGEPGQAAYRTNANVNRKENDT